MQATRPLLSIVLLLSVALSGPAIAEYPFESMDEAGSAPRPSRPLGSGLRDADVLSRKLFPKVTQASHESPLVDPPMVPGAMLDGGMVHRGTLDEAMVNGPMVAGQMMPGGGYDMSHFGGGGYDSVPFDGGGYDTVPYEGGPYGGGPYADGPYDTVPYDEFGPAGGDVFDKPYPRESLFGFDRAIWPGFISGNLMPGTDRFLYGGELFVPLYQDGVTMWYFNFRGQGDDNSASEFNTGTGVRVITEPGWIFGAYTYWDHLKSRHGNRFNQGMIGVEAMSVLWDARMNVYFPESGGQSAGPAVAAISGGNLVVRTGIERAYWGMDFEVGHLLWAFGPNAQHEVRGFAAIYHFDHSAPGYSSITGPRVRGEYRWHDLPYFGPGSRFTCGLTLQADGERDAQLFAFARLRIPLDAWAHSRRPLSPLHRRMLDNVVRDVDVVTNSARQTERAVNPITGREIRGYARIDANTSNANDLLGDLDTDAVIVVDGSKGVIHAPSGYMLKTGQTVIGADTPFDVVGASSRRRATFDPRGERPTLDFGKYVDHGHLQIEAGDANVPFHGDVAFDAAEATYGLRMNDQTQLVGVDIQNVDIGVDVKDADDVLIQDVSVSDYGTAGIRVAGSTNVRLDDVRVKNAAVGPWFESNPYQYPYGRGIVVAGSSNVTIEDSHIEDAKMEGIFVLGSQNVTIRRTTIRDTWLEGIRLVNTKHVRIEDVELKNTGGKIPGFSDWNLVSYQLIGSISLDETENTVIRDSLIHGSEGYGIFGKGATDTLIEGLDIANVEHGIWFDSLSPGHNITITDTTIRLPDEQFRAYPEVTDFVTLFGTSATTTGDVNGYIPHHSGIVVQNATGEVVIEGNDIQGGYAGWGILAESREPSTDLRIEGNVITTYGESRGIGLQTGNFDNLDAVISGNTVHSGGEAFWLHASGHPDDPGNNVHKSLTLSDNEWNGPIRARVLGSAELEMTVKDNHFGGNPMGFIRAEDDARVNLQYTGNTSNAGAGMLHIINDGGDLSATFNGNDHTPVMQTP